MLLRDLSQGSKFGDAGVGENDIDSPLRLDGLIETIKVGQFGNVSLNASNVAADRRYGLVEFLLTTARDEDIGTLFHEELCCSQPYPGGATSNHCYLSLQLLSFGHGSSPHPSFSCWAIVFGTVSSRGYLSMVGRLGNR